MPTPPPAAIRPDPQTEPDPGFAKDWLREVLACVPSQAGDTAQQAADAREAALILLDAMGPKDPAAAMLAAHAVATYKAAMDAYRQANTAELPFPLACRLRSGAATLSRMTMNLIVKLQRWQGSQASQPVPALPAMRALLQAAQGANEKNDRTTS